MVMQELINKIGEVLLFIIMAMLLSHLTIKTFCLWIFAIITYNIFNFETKKGFLFIIILSSCISFIIVVILAFKGTYMWNIYLTAFTDLICVFGVSYFLKKCFNEL